MRKLLSEARILLVQSRHGLGEVPVELSEKHMDDWYNQVHRRELWKVALCFASLVASLVPKIESIACRSIPSASPDTILNVAFFSWIIHARIASARRTPAIPIAGPSDRCRIPEQVQISLEFEANFQPVLVDPARCGFGDHENQEGGPRFSCFPPDGETGADPGAIVGTRPLLGLKNRGGGERSRSRDSRYPQGNR